MRALPSFDYAIVRVVPVIEREELANVGAVVFCPEHDFLDVKIELDEGRLRAFFPTIDLPLIEEHLEAFERTCRGGPDGGPIGALPIRERWHWLVAPKNTVIQTSAPHSGLCESPARLLERLLDRHVRPPKGP